MSNAVKHPSHYAEGRKYEPKDVIRDWGLNFNLGNAVKYLARAGRKDDIVQDLKKAQEYIQFEIDAIEAERAQAELAKYPKHPNCKCDITAYEDKLSDMMLHGLAPSVIALVRTEAREQAPKEKECITISLGNLAGMTAKSFSEKYLRTNKVRDLEVTAGSKRYFVDTVDRNVENGMFLLGQCKEKVHIRLKDKSCGSTVEINLEDK